MRGEFIDVGGARIYYYAAGTRGSGEPVVLIHGLLTSSHLWNRVVPLVPTGHRVVVPDLIGYGRSDPPTATGQTADVSAQGHAIRLLRLLDALDVDKACLAAHGAGASVALAALASHPDRVTRLCLIGPLTQASPPRSAHLTGIAAPSLAAMPLRLQLAIVRRALSRGYLHPAFFAHSVEQYVRPFSVPAGSKALLAHLHTVARGTALEPLPAPGANPNLPPTTIVWGTDDPVVAPSARLQLRALMPGSQQVVVAGGHFSPEESPEQVAAVLAALLTPAEGA